ncbi:thiol-disulfide oxidoreductase DCC family protein [Bdellovibrio sp. HCB337]|uniref:thiol-disulfide oxidoreductase DCC family protein n=1 Tax=Bdellovibrio sp. HCB337 TaxID=3394358 RepID=UPI0039A4E0D9
MIFFDGICHLCNHFVDAIITRDKLKQFQFAPLQGETAKKILTSEEISRLDSIVLVENEHKYQSSEAVLRILIKLGGPYRLFYVAWLIPAPLRDALYSWIARHRYAWFGQSNSCRLPTPEEKDRLLP